MRASAASKGERAGTLRRAERRLSDALNCLGARNMNDTKWREVISVLSRRLLHAKFVDEGEVRELNLYSLTNSPAASHVTDSTAGPVEYRYIEWVEYRQADHREVRLELERLGWLPLVPLSDGFRLQAHGPIRCERTAGHSWWAEP